ncbi:hypothetical protein [Lentzea sp. NPDC055074]
MRARLRRPRGSAAPPHDQRSEHFANVAEHLARDGGITHRFRARDRALRGHFAPLRGEVAAVVAFLEGASTVRLLDPGTTDPRAMRARYLSRLQNGDTGPTPAPSG